MMRIFFRKKDKINFYIKKYLELDEQKKRDEELTVLTKLIELDPRCENSYRNFRFNHYYNRGVLYGYLDQQHKAIADYTKAIELNPNHDLALGNRGVCYKILGDLDRYRQDIALAVKANPNSLHFINLKDAGGEMNPETTAEI